MILFIFDLLNLINSSFLCVDNVCEYECVLDCLWVYRSYVHRRVHKSNWGLQLPLKSTVVQVMVCVVELRHDKNASLVLFQITSWLSSLSYNLPKCCFTFYTRLMKNITKHEACFFILVWGLKALRFMHHTSQWYTLKVSGVNILELCDNSSSHFNTLRCNSLYDINISSECECVCCMASLNALLQLWKSLWWYYFDWMSASIQLKVFACQTVLLLYWIHLSNKSNQHSFRWGTSYLLWNLVERIDLLHFVCLFSK